MNDMPSVAVGLSGGVDSSVAAALLVQAGYRVSGLTMRIWDGPETGQPGCRQGCYGPGEEEDVAACEALCSRLGIPYTVVDLSREYERTVLEYFRTEYLRGRTPNPCVLCNHVMKFGFLLDRARIEGLRFDLFATGHYARVQERNGRPCLRTAADPSKDQSYFLHRLKPEVLGKVLFPLGEKTKPEVRDIARSLGLEVSEKPESQDFVSGGDYSSVFSGRESPPGDIVDTEGRVLGRHRGIHLYTIGQRRGLGVSSGPDPLYVLRLDPDRNHVVVGPGEGLFSEGLEAEDAVLSDPSLEDAPFECRVRIRQNHAPAEARVTVRKGSARVLFRTPQRAVAPGQSAVFYDEAGFVLGGGVIEKALPREG